MTISILIVSHSRDIERLKYCLLSIDKFVSGYEEIVLAVPDSQKELFVPLANRTGRCRLYSYREFPGLGFLHHCVTVCYSDVICGTDYVLNLDSDCMFIKPAQIPEAFHVEGMPVIFRSPYHKLRESKQNKDWQRLWWKRQASRAVGRDVEFEYMMGPPHCFPKQAYKRLREMVEAEHGKPFHDYVFEQKPDPLWGFADIDMLGYAANHPQINCNTFVDITDPRFAEAYQTVGGCIKRFWSHTPLEEDKTEMEWILSEGEDGNEKHAVYNPVVTPMDTFYRYARTNCK